MLIDVARVNGTPRRRLQHAKALQQRGAVLPASADVVDGTGREFWMNASNARTTSRLWIWSRTCFPLYPVTVRVPGHGHPDQVRKESVEFDAGMRGFSHAPCPEDADRHPEVVWYSWAIRSAATFLDAPNSKCGDASIRQVSSTPWKPSLGLGIVIARFVLDDRKLVRRVSVHLVRAHVNDHRVQAVSSGPFEDVCAQRAPSIHIEVHERQLARFVVDGLRRAMDGAIEPCSRKRAMTRFRSRVSSARCPKRPLSRTRPAKSPLVARRAEQFSMKIAVEPDDDVAALIEVAHGFGADQATGSGH